MTISIDFAAIRSTPVACVDVGGTKVAVSVADRRGLHGQLTEPTEKKGSNDALAQQVVRMVEQSCSAAGVSRTDLTAVGISSCGPFALKDGMVELSQPNICGGLAGPERGLPNDWQTAQLEAPVRQAFASVSCTVRVENDGMAALEAERRWGALQGVDHCAYVTWSTGVGVGLCVDGRVLRGKNGNAGHAGHMFVSDDEESLCGCGNHGDVEALIAGNALARRFASQGYADAATLFKAAGAGDAAAGALVDEACRVLGRMLYDLVIVLDLQRISLGGGVFWPNQAHLLPRLHAQLKGRLTALTDGVELVPAGLGDKVGDYAALALVA
ncbi:MAG: ROK family protein [Burkholderiaceae bacterium]|nr:MAG: ROK family protein [Burkholderiaceae bacterium]